MTAKTDALRALLEAVKAGEMPITWRAFGSDQSSDGIRMLIHDAFHGSLDAAKALHDAVLGKAWEATIDVFPRDDGFVSAWVAENLNHNKNARSVSVREYGIDPARAWLIAILEALIAKDTAND